MAWVVKPQEKCEEERRAEDEKKGKETKRERVAAPLHNSQPILVLFAVVLVV